MVAADPGKNTDIPGKVNFISVPDRRTSSPFLEIAVGFGDERVSVSRSVVRKPRGSAKLDKLALVENVTFWVAQPKLSHGDFGGWAPVSRVVRRSCRSAAPPPWPAFLEIVGTPFGDGR